MIFFKFNSFFQKSFFFQLKKIIIYSFFNLLCSRDKKNVFFFKSNFFLKLKKIDFFFKSENSNNIFFKSNLFSKIENNYVFF